MGGPSFLEYRLAEAEYKPKGKSRRKKPWTHLPLTDLAVRRNGLFNCYIPGALFTQILQRNGSDCFDWKWGPTPEDSFAFSQKG